MRGAILDEVRRMDWFSRTLRQKQSRVQSAIQELTQSLGRFPEEEEIAVNMELKLDDYRLMLSEISHLGCVSLHETIDDSEHGACLLDNLADESLINADEMLETHELTLEIAGHIERLSEKERLVITLYYYEELTQKEIAEVLDLSEGRVSQLHSQALIKLKSHIGRGPKKPRLGR